MKSRNGNCEIQLPWGKCLPDAIATILFDVIQAIIHLTPNKSFYTLLKKAAPHLTAAIGNFVCGCTDTYDTYRCIWVYQSVLCNFVIKLNFCYGTLRIIYKRSASTKFCLQFNGTSLCQSVPLSTGWGRLTQDAKRLKVYKKEKQLAKWFTRSLPCPATKSNNNNQYNNNLADSSKIIFQFPSCLWAFSWHRLLLCVFNQIIMTSKQNTDGSTSPSHSLSLSASASAFTTCGAQRGAGRVRRLPSQTKQADARYLPQPLPTQVPTKMISKFIKT